MFDGFVFLDSTPSNRASTNSDAGSTSKKVPVMSYGDYRKSKGKQWKSLVSKSGKQ